MKDSVAWLSRYVELVPRRLTQWSQAEIRQRPAPGKWSKQEILGHLCDSAINNVSRFIRAQQSEGPFVVTGYDQVEWVKAQQYQQTHLEEVVALWVSLN